MDLNDKKSVTGGIFANSGDAFQVANPNRIVSFANCNVQPPAMSYIGVDDDLIIHAFASATSFPINVNVRILRADGQIISMPFTIPANIGRAGVVLTEQALEGYIVGISAMSTGIFNFGQYAYVSVGIARNPGGDGSVYIPLMAGYIHDKIAFGFPNTELQRPTDGAGVISSVVISAPAAGADFTVSVPAGARYRLISLFATLTTAVAVANRGVTLVVDDGVNILGQYPAQTVQAASLAVGYTFGDSVTGQASVQGFESVSTPGMMFLGQNWRIRSVTSNIQAADQWSAGRMLIQEWLDPA